MTEQEKFRAAVVQQGYSAVQAARIAGIVYPETPADRRRASLAKAHAARRRKAAERSKASAEVTETMLRDLQSANAG
jgi:hypothetical protein